MAPDDADDTQSALAALRAMPTERAEEEAAERAAVPESVTAQATRVIVILEERQGWSLDARRALGLPASIGSDDWEARVREHVSTLDAVAVVDAWLDLVEGGGGYRTLAVAADALSRLSTTAPLAERIQVMLRDGSEDTVRYVKEALVASRVPVDDSLLRVLRRLLVDGTRQTASAALTIAGELARREPAVAAMIAERIRMDRVRWRHEVHQPLSTPPQTVPSDAAARVVERSGCASLAATAILQLEERADPQWARALVAVAGDEGRAHLQRMRTRPGWSAFAPASDPVGLDALVSPVADARRRALEALAGVPQADHVRALLLATELDRYVIRDLLQLTWTRPQVTAWLPLLSRRGVDDPIAAARAEHLLVGLVDAGVAHTGSDNQVMTPALQELSDDGVVAFVHRHIPDPRLSADELASLDAGEAALAASAARWWG
jgi:hypothetical protein